MSEKLKPCPLCNGEMALFTVNLATRPEEDEIDARCGKCGTEFHLRGDGYVVQGGYNIEKGAYENEIIRGKSALDKWNTRYYEDNSGTEN